MISAVRKSPDPIPAWLETEYCTSVAATLLARTEYFESIR